MKQNLLIKAAFVLMTLLSIGMNARAQYNAGNTFRYNGLAFLITSEEDKTAKLHNYYEETTPSAWIKETITYSGVINIPSTAEFKGTTYTVTEIGSLAFKNNTVTELYIPASIKIVRSFPGSTLEKVTIEDSDSVLYFESSSYNNGCKEWYIGRNVMREGDSTYNSHSFYHLFSKAEHITVGNMVTNLHSYQFEDSNVKTLVIGNGITEIPQGLCNRCRSLEQVNIPASVLTIGK
ncbi:MAG: leucine-rich repeat protein, partial [Prevotella sp.]|nr:leucine-rich repeat protein [Prevotella sp.]